MRLIELGGQKRPVNYTINALIEFEQLTGVSVFDRAELPAALRSLKNIRTLVFVGLKWGAIQAEQAFEHTEVQVGTWLSFTDGSIDRVMEAFGNDMGLQPDMLPASGTGEPAKN
jgi:hypothetical protein